MSKRRWYKDAYGLKDWVLIALLLGGIFAFVFGIFFVAIQVDSRACDRDGHRLGRETTYDALASGCYVVLPDGREVPLDQYIYNEEQEG